MSRDDETVAAMLPQLADVRAEGRVEERAAIVAYLRGPGLDDGMADEIERGEHLRLSDSNPSPDAVISDNPSAPSVALGHDATCVSCNTPRIPSSTPSTGSCTKANHVMLPGRCECGIVRVPAPSAEPMHVEFNRKMDEHWKRREESSPSIERAGYWEELAYKMTARAERLEAALREIAFQCRCTCDVEEMPPGTCGVCVGRGVLRALNDSTRMIEPAAPPDPDWERERDE